LRKLQTSLIVILLLGVVYGVNAYDTQRRQKAETLAKEAEKAKRSAEATAASKSAPKAGPGTHAAAAFALPKSSGAPDAPVKLEIFVNDANSCHEVSVGVLGDLQKTYGKLLRSEWYTTSDPKASARADKLKIGCEAGLVINGKIEAMVERDGGKALVSFRGPVGDKYKVEDVYRATNLALRAAGRKPPAAALERARISTATPHAAH
jgi:hypothetical protein